jgi:hypothetical protein
MRGIKKQTMENFVITESGARVYARWQDNICCEDKDNKALTEKARLQRETYSYGMARGCKRFGSANSEDALSWSVFRTLQLKNGMDLFYGLLGISDFLQTTIFWTRDTKTGNPDKDLTNVINEVEPKSMWRIQQTEPDIILRGKTTLIFIEAKLGRPGAKINAWARQKEFEKRHYRYRDEGFLNGLFTQDFIDNFTSEGKRFYQLMRNYVIGHKLARVWNLDFYLCALVNGLNHAKNGNSYGQEFSLFKNYLINKNAYLVSWQDLMQRLKDRRELRDLSVWMHEHPCLRDAEN